MRQSRLEDAGMPWVVLRFALILVALSVSPAPHALAQDKPWRIGFLSGGLPPVPDKPGDLAAFQQGLDGLGYQEGRNYVIEGQFADTDASRLPALAKELVERRVDVIVTIGTPAVRAAKEATTTIPIIMAGGNDPVGNGLIASLARPGGNVTGVAHTPGPEIAGKGLQLLKEAAPHILRVAVLAAGVGPASYHFPSLNVLRAVAGELSVTLLVHDVTKVRSAGDFDAILSAIMEERADAVFVFPDFQNRKYKNTLFDFLSTKHRVPSMFQHVDLVEEGGLLGYYTDFLELRRLSASYVDKIFKGASAVDLPVEEPSRFVFIVNLRTAKMLDLMLPQAILIFADKIIE